MMHKDKQMAPRKPQQPFVYFENHESEAHPIFSFAQPSFMFAPYCFESLNNQEKEIIMQAESLAYDQAGCRMI